MLIDPAIRDKVLLPLIVFVVIFSLGRTYLFQLMMPKPGDSAAPSANQNSAATGEAAEGLREELKQKNTVARSGRLRANMGYISSGAVGMRKNWLLGSGSSNARDEDKGVLKEDLSASTAVAAANPFAALDQMKMQMVNQGVWLGIFYAIQNVLAGFLVVKIPFGLTERFKALTQQGIGVSALDTSFVSSGSWYMIAQQGLTRVLQLLNVGSVVSEQQLMQMQMMGPMAGAAGQQGQPWNGKQAYQAEASALAVSQYRSALVDSEAELIAAAKLLPPRRNNRSVAR